VDQQQSNGMMGFWQHLDELKTRLVRSLIGFFVGFGICYTWTNDYVFRFLQQPLFNALPPEQHKLYFTSLFENFLTHVKMAGYSSIFLFSPFYFYQLWAFIAPGLHPRERRLVLPFIFSTTFFFVAGAAFAYYGLFPIGFKYFITYGLPTDAPLLTIDSYYGTCLKLMLMFGVAFELPVILVALGYFGLLEAATLRTHRRNAFIGITVVSAFIAPPDAISMLILMAPLYLMYEGATIVIAIFEKKRRLKDKGPDDKPPPYDPFVGQSQ
jgi:sec-independent protein translocase protein TatC